MAYKQKHTKSSFPFKTDKQDKKNKKEKKDRLEPTYWGTDEYRKEKDIPTQEFIDRGVKPPKNRKNTIGEGFMRPPYRGPKGKGPRAKRQGFHGYKNFKSNLDK